MPSRSTMQLALVAACCVLTCGCANYYKVTDPTTNKVYYTQRLDRHDGSVTFTDARSQAQVTLQNSAVEPITQQQFKAAQSGTPAP